MVKKDKKVLDRGLYVVYHVTCLATKRGFLRGNHLLG